jgi:hypothetical protein
MQVLHDKSAAGDGDAHHAHLRATPWVSAEEMQPPQRPQSSTALDEVDEALLESFPCSDPPCHSHAHA